jgi:hypothetical protein
VNSRQNCNAPGISITDILLNLNPEIQKTKYAQQNKGRVRSKLAGIFNYESVKYPRSLPRRAR